MPFLKIPHAISTCTEAHKKWLQILKDAQSIVETDLDYQEKAKKGLLLKERRLPPEILGRTYADYCSIINKMYDTYLNSVHLQRAPCILEIISVFLKRLYELRNELVHLIVNDYIYVDDALIACKKTPFDIEIIIPYHFPLESRKDTMEQLLQTMWSDAIRRKNSPQVTEEPHAGQDPFGNASESDLPRFVKESSVQIIKDESVHTIIPEEFIQINIIQRQERFRQYFLEDYKAKCKRRKIYFCENVVEAPIALKIKAAKLIQRIYRIVMARKREEVRETKRNILLGLVPDPFVQHLKFEDENDKMYERKWKLRKDLLEVYAREMEKEKTRLVVFKRNNQIDDITQHVLAWFREWFYGYGFFPEYPYDVEGGTMMVIRGDYPTIEEKILEDEKNLAATKGKTKEQIKAEKQQAKADALLKAQAAKEQAQKEAEVLFKLRCNPQSDPGYKIRTSEHTKKLQEALQKYRAAWSLYDDIQPDKCGNVIYGYMQSILTEELMTGLHQECRRFVDEMMRLDLKLLVAAHQQMYKNVGWKYPKLKPRPKPKSPPVLKRLNVEEELLASLEQVFDLEIITKPTRKLKDIYGDLNYAAYDFNLRDPDAKFPPPGYLDVRRRLKLSCVFGSGIEPGADRKKAVMLLGPKRNGKSFLVDAVAGELNAIKIDITPEVFSAVLEKPAKVLPQVFLAARVFQPAVIYLRNIERVFCKKVLPENRYLKANKLKAILPKLVKQIAPEDQIIFIATCSDPFVAQERPMTSVFDEIILVPRTDYGTVRSYFYYKLQSIRSMPRDFCVQALAQSLQGYGFGVILELFHRVMTAERIVRLNVTPLCPTEFLEPLLDMREDATSLDDYQPYVDFFIRNSPLRKERQEYEIINSVRAVIYDKIAKAKAKKT